MLSTFKGVKINMKFKIKKPVISLFFLLSTSAVIYAENPPVQSPERLIRSVYSEHQPWKKKTIILQDKDSLARYFDEQLSELILKENECVKTTRELCNLDFDPIMDAQDFEATKPDLKIIKVQSKVDSLSYKVTFTNISKRTLIYQLCDANNGWKICDIVYPDGNTLKSILSKKID